MAIEKVLIVDDEMLVRDFLAETLRRKNLDVTTAENGEQAVKILKDQTFDMVITDMKMPGMTGIEVLRHVKELSPNTLVIVITAYGSIENAVEAMKLGAFNYLIKPFSPDTIEAIIEKAKEHKSLVEENQYLRKQISGGQEGADHVIGVSSAMQKILTDVAQIAKSNANVFINGESGTGKEVIAQAIHQQSLRANNPYIKVNCAAIPETLIESEFFGHEKGAFTGANSKRLGRFELANNGTLLLDEVTEVPIMLQAKLLRVIQEQEFERVGGGKPIKVDVRLISTSNRVIEEAIKDQVLREDLYYRLNVVPINIPPLRERPDDIIPLANHFLEKMCQENHKEKKVLTEGSTQKLLSYGWPGNVRELANIIERAVVMSQTPEIDPEFLYVEGSTPTTSSQATKVQVGVSLQEMEKQMIIETFYTENKNRTRTAEVLGISPRTLRYKLKQFEVS